MVTREDLLTILTFGVHIAKVDGDFSQLEKFMLGQLAGLMDISAEEKTRLRDRKETLFELLDNMSSPEAKNLLIKALCLMAHADGKIFRVERDFLERLIEVAEKGFQLKEPHQWGSYESDVRGAFLFFAR